MKLQKQDHGRPTGVEKLKEGSRPWSLFSSFLEGDVTAGPPCQVLSQLLLEIGPLHRCCQQMLWMKGSLFPVMFVTGPDRHMRQEMTGSYKKIAVCSDQVVNGCSGHVNSDSLVNPVVS